MQRLKMKVLGAALLLGTFALLASPAKAVTSQNIDIHVSITATKSLSANTTTYDFGAMQRSSGSGSASSITVTNDSTVLIETYTIQGANAIAQDGGASWTLAASTGTEQYVLAAEFSNSVPANTDAAFANSDTTTGVQTCSATVFGNGTVGESGSAVSPVNGSNARGLWFRLITPSITSDPGAHKATITLAVL